MSAALAPIPRGRRYRVVLADPAWLFEVRTGAGGGKSPQAQYRCLSRTDLLGFAAEIGLAEVLAPRAALLMWSTWPMVARGDHAETMRAWGFEPKTGGAWTKTTAGGRLGFGTGYLFRSASEPFLLGTRHGGPRRGARDIRNALLDGDGAGSGAFGHGLPPVVARAAGHSVKPPAMHAMLERLFPGGPYLELFARRVTPGWDAYGDEIGGFVAGHPAPLREIAA